MPSDLLLPAIQAATTKTATFNGAGVTLPRAAMRSEQFVRVLVTDAHNASGSNTAQFQVDVSLDGGATWLAGTPSAPPVTLSTTVQSYEVNEPFFVTASWLAQASNTAQIRLTLTIAGAGTGPSVSYSADWAFARN